jgi:6-phosphogluconolactonase
MSVRWHTYPDAAAAAEACSHYITGILEEVLSGQDRATFAISGGQTPKLLFERLAHSGFRWDCVHFFWVDERCVPPTDLASNYRLADECLFKPAHVPHRNVHRIDGELHPTHAARRYVEDIQEVFNLRPGKVPHFDIMHLGMGPEGHTASLFPGSPALDDREAIASAVPVQTAAPPWRVTLMPAVLLAARHTVFLVTGDDKAEAVRNVFHGDYDPKRYPAQMASHHARRVAWFLDQAAARLMD